MSEKLFIVGRSRRNAWKIFAGGRFGEQIGVARRFHRLRACYNVAVEKQKPRRSEMFILYALEKLG